MEILSNPDSAEAVVASAKRSIVRILSTDDVDGDAKKKGALAADVVKGSFPAEFKVDAVEALDRKFNVWQLGDIQKALKPFAEDPVVGEIVARILEK